MSRREWAIIIFITGVAIALLIGFYEESKTNSLYDLLLKFSFAALIAVVARLVGFAFANVDSQKERERDIYERFLKFGMKDIHDPLTHIEIRDILSDSRKIKILKTWFPETPIIADGLKNALKKKASVKLLLLEPNSELLKKRSIAAEKSENHGSDHVRSALEHMKEWVCKNGWGDVVQIGLYNEWSGCPVIWCDERIFTGFYFRGNSSDSFPWIEVRQRSELEEILNNQFNSLWQGSNNSEKFENLKQWFDKNISYSKS